MGPPKFGAPGNCPICPPLKPALIISSTTLTTIMAIIYYKGCDLLPISLVPIFYRCFSTCLTPLSHSITIYLSLSLSHSTSISLTLSLYLSHSLYLSLSIFLSISLYLSLSLSLSLSPSLSLSLSLSLSISLSLSL